MARPQRRLGEVAVVANDLARLACRCLQRGLERCGVVAAFGPSSHTIFSASRPCIAAHVLRAMTATPPSGLNAPRPESRRSHDLHTPGTFSASVASKLFTVPPYTCGRATTA